MKSFRVVWEIQIDADSALDAALIAQGYQRDIRGDNTANQFYVQDEKTLEVVSVDLDEELVADAVLPVKEYEPLIQNKK